MYVLKRCAKCGDGGQVGLAYCYREPDGTIIPPEGWELLPEPEIESDTPYPRIPVSHRSRHPIDGIPEQRTTAPLGAQRELFGAELPYRAPSAGELPEQAEDEMRDLPET